MFFYKRLAGKILVFVNRNNMFRFSIFLNGDRNYYET